MSARLIVRVTKERGPGTVLLSISLYLLFSLFLTYAFAQEPTEERTASNSELAKDNLERVAASESQITAVLNANPGLFVELKRWVAKDAAERGQIIKDADLIDSAILLRLPNNVRFRAADGRA